MLRLVFGISLLALGACASGPGGKVMPVDKSVAANPNEIVIGVAGPMRGDLAAFGEQIRRGAQMAVKDINAAGGVLGRQLRLVVGDDQCDPRRATNVATDMVKQGAVFVDGHFCSGSSIPASAIYAEKHIVQITPSSTNPRLTDDNAASGVTTVFRTTGRDDLQGVVAGAWLAKHYAGRSVAVVDDRSAYGSGLVQRLVPAMRAAGLEPSVTADYRQRMSSHDDLIAKLVAAKPAAVYIGGYHDDIGVIVKEARAVGITADFLGADALNTSEFWSIAGDAGEGLRFSDAASSVDLPSAKVAVAAFQADGYEPEGYTLNSYAAVQAWAVAANKAGTTEGSKVAAVLHSTTIPTVIGDLTWDAKGDLTKVVYAWFVWHDGRYSQEPMD